MKRKTLFYTSCIATASNNISSLHFAMILTHTITCSHIFCSETKYCYSRNDVRSQLVLFSTIPRLWTWKRANLPTLKIHIKLTKIATTIIFSQWWSGEKGNLYEQEIFGGVSGTLSVWNKLQAIDQFFTKQTKINLAVRSRWIEIGIKFPFEYWPFFAVIYKIVLWLYSVHVASC